MQSDRDLLTEQWRAVAKALSIRFDGPYSVPGSTGAYQFAGLVPDFGGGRGTLIDTEYDREAMSVAKAAGFTGSFMLPEKRLIAIEASSYAECLVDWGWSGDGDPPEWYAHAV